MASPVELYIATMLRIYENWRDDPEYRRGEAFDILNAKIEQLQRLLTAEEFEQAWGMLRDLLGPPPVHIDSNGLMPRRQL